MQSYKHHIVKDDLASRHGVRERKKLDDIDYNIKVEKMNFGLSYQQSEAYAQSKGKRLGTTGEIR